MLSLSRLTDYGVVLLCEMATASARIRTAADLAEATGVPLPTVSKLLRLLARSEIVASQRGVHGGYVLARDPREVTAADIVTALDGPVALTACVDGNVGACKSESICPIRGRWDAVNIAIKQALANVTLADLASPPDFIQVRPAHADGAGRPA
jgi:FeS assembly SUF system regulator